MAMRKNKTKIEEQKFAREELARLGQDFKKKRLAAGLTHEEVRAQTGISVSTVHHLEHGMGIGLETYIILLRCVGYQLD